MKKTPLLLLCLAMTICITAQKRYLFQYSRLSNDERLDNLVSLRTLEEKIDNLSPRLAGVPRLGVQGAIVAAILSSIKLIKIISSCR